MFCQVGPLSKVFVDNRNVKRKSGVALKSFRVWAFDFFWNDTFPVCMYVCMSCGVVWLALLFC